MSKGKRFNILVVDKKSIYIEKFRGLRKNKFQVHSVANLLKQSTIELDEVDTFFLVLYNYRDVIQLINLTNHSNIIIGSDNSSILKSMSIINKYKVVDLSSRFDLCSVLSLHKN